jgi:Na+-driven multidrug efflux pump
MIDGVVSGHVLGLDALAATSILFPLVTLSTFCSKLISTGCSTLCAVAKGERNHERANRLFTLGLMATF